MEKDQRAATGRDSEKYILRMPEGMRDRIKAAAEANNRTMNAEFIARLEASFEPASAPAEATHLLGRVMDEQLLMRIDAMRGRLAAAEQEFWNLEVGISNRRHKLDTLTSDATLERHQLQSEIDAIQGRLTATKEYMDGLRHDMELLEVRLEGR